MFEGGLVEEVRALLGDGLRDGVTASRALGYAQVIAALDAGGATELLRDAREQTFVGTRRYVRRQRSWFRRDHRVHWLDVADGLPASSTTRCRRGGTYPELVEFAKGHGTQNDFVLLPDVEAGLAADRCAGSPRCATGAAAWAPTACCG